MRISHLCAVISAMLLVVCVSSCSNKEGAALFEGSYSFKTSGSLKVEKTLSEEIGDESPSSTEATLSLTAESGQMNIVKDGKNQVIITMNIIGSDVLVFKGEVSGQTLNITEAKRTANIHDGSISAAFDCTVNGYAKKYDDLLIFTLSYSGDGSSALYSYTIISSEVNCVAKLNK